MTDQTLIVNNIDHIVTVNGDIQVLGNLRTVNLDSVSAMGNLNLYSGSAENIGVTMNQGINNQSNSVSGQFIYNPNTRTFTLTSKDSSHINLIVNGDIILHKGDEKIDLLHRIDQLQGIIDQLSQMITKIYFSPSMPGAIECEASFLKTLASSQSSDNKHPK